MSKEDKQQQKGEKKHGKRDKMSLKCLLGCTEERCHTFGEIVRSSLENALNGSSEPSHSHLGS